MPNGTDANIETQVTKNLVFIVNNHFLNYGCYDTISITEEDFNNNDQSMLYPVDDHQYPASGNYYRVWQSPYSNWVYESGIIPPTGMDAPKICSGVYVSGSFYDRNDSEYGHFIDYSNGRIVFDTPKDALLEGSIATDFSYKIVDIKIPEKNDEYFTGRIFVMNPQTSPLFTIASGYMERLPKLLLEYADDEPVAVQLGGGRQMNIHILMHILTNDKYMRGYIKDVGRWLDRRRYKLIDWGLVDDPISYNGDLSDPSSGFDLLSLQNDNSLFYGLLEFDSMRTRNVRNPFNFYQGVLDFDVNVRQLGYT